MSNFIRAMIHFIPREGSSGSVLGLCGRRDCGHGCAGGCESGCNVTTPELTRS
jgi:hypothetical protein